MPLQLKIFRFAMRRPVLFCLLGTALLYACVVGRYLVWPPLGGLADSNPESTAFMDYRRAQWRAEGKEVAERQTWKELKRISSQLRRAVVAAEDDTFWEHEGFFWEGMRLALEKNLASGSLSVGGSTITQQLAKNLFLSPQRSLTRKLQEAILAWRLENALSKERILELYLNVAEWGEGIYGAEAAARHYFGVSAGNLSRRQAALLAALLPNPLGRSPNSRHVQQVADRIIRNMH